jgi:organic radical activating enzyme
VKDSWDVDRHPKIEIKNIVGEALKHPGRLAVVTGGEPLMHNCTALTDELHKAGFTTNIETSGSYPLTGDWDWICVSPKKFKAPLQAILPLANELKVVIFNKSDFAWAEKYAAMVAPGCKLYLQPEWEKSALVTPMIIDYILRHPKWEISLQIHKYIHVP